MNRLATLRRLPWAAAACVLVAAQSGCTTALTAASLRDGMWPGTEHAAEGDERPADPAGETAPPSAEPVPAADRERREAALEEAMARLARLGPLDPAVEAAIVATLQRTEPEDWPVVVEEFSTSLAAAPPAAAPPVPQPPASEPEAPPAVTDEPAPSPVGTATGDGAATPVADDAPPGNEPDPAPPVVPQPEPVAVPAPPPLAVRRACFASAVRGWGDVEPFACDRFRPGQEVIVYVELDNLSAGTSPAGHTTCIDAVLRLVDEAGRPLHAWSFDPVAETTPAPRHDYFARYVLRIPDTLSAGACRVEAEVTDTLAGSTANAVLPLEVAAAAE